ncbi:MAG: CoA-binding protein [bacterium]|nr:CoA-binding protein [bacterium]
MSKDLNQDEAARRAVLENSKVIAMVGHSNDHYYTSYQVAAYLREHGYVVYPVNPHIDEVEGHKSYDTLRDIPAEVDIVNVFRKSQFLFSIAEEAAVIGAKSLWAQLGVFDDDARHFALGAGINYAQDLCIRTEHERIFGKK